MGEKVYKPRHPKRTKLWQCLHVHFDDYLNHYKEKYEKTYGYLRPIIEDVVNKYLECGDLSKGFARIVCQKCKQEYLLAFSCRGRWFCPSCHQKKVLHFGENITANIAYPVPHRQYVFCLPIMLRAYFKHDREMLTKLCQQAYKCLQEFMRASLRLPQGQAGMVMAIQTYGEYLNFHPHIHAAVADGLFTSQGMFYVMPRLNTQALEEMFRVRVIRLLVAKRKLAKDLGGKLLGWRHSGFSVHKGEVVKREARLGLERLAQYIIRNLFSEEKMMYNEKMGSIIYRSKPNPKVKGNFKVFTAGEFIGAITQHIPDKGFQLVRYYGWYSNKCRGIRAKIKKCEVARGLQKTETEIIDISSCQAPKVPSKKWRELIKKIWEVDPLICPRCGGEMRIVALLDDSEIIEKILRHLNTSPRIPRLFRRG